MTRVDYKRRLGELHPDFNGGDASRVEELHALIFAWRLDHARCARRGCNQRLSRTQVQRGGLYCGVQCLNRATARRKAKKISTGS